MTEWKNIKGFEEKYKINKQGEVYSNITGKMLKPIIKKGYCRYVLHTCNNKKCKYKFGHRLVAEAFLEDYSDDLQVDHINNIRTDNRVENLRMVNNQENCNNPNSNICKSCRVYFKNGDIKEYKAIKELIKDLKGDMSIDDNLRTLIWKCIKYNRGSEKYNIEKIEYI